jgi:hypothetical protein
VDIWSVRAFGALAVALIATSWASPTQAAPGQEDYYTNGKCQAVCGAYIDWWGHTRIRAVTRHCLGLLRRAHETEKALINSPVSERRRLAAKRTQEITDFQDCFNQRHRPSDGGSPAEENRRLIAYLDCVGADPANARDCDGFRPNGFPRYPGSGPMQLRYSGRGYVWVRPNGLPQPPFENGSRVYGLTGLPIGVWRGGKVIPYKR